MIVPGGTQHRVSPWSDRGRRLLVFSIALAAMGVTSSWFFASGLTDPGDQLVFAGISLLAIVGEFLGVWQWICEGRRSIRRYRRDLFAGFATEGQGSALTAAASSDVLVTLPAGQWLHRADCPFVKGRGRELVSAEHRGAAHRPCPACRP